MAGQAKISARLEAFLEAGARRRAQAHFEADRLVVEKVGKGRLKARAEVEDAAHEVFLRLEGTGFSFGCDCPAGTRKQLCEHVFAAVLVAESIGVEGFGRRVLNQSGRAGAPEESAGSPDVSDGDVESADSGERVAAVPRADRGQLPLIEVEGLGPEGGALRVALVQWWRLADGKVVSRSRGWSGLKESELRRSLTPILEVLMELPLDRESSIEDLGRWGARRDTLLSGASVSIPADYEHRSLATLVKTGQCVLADEDPEQRLRWTGRVGRISLRPQAEDGDQGSGWRIAATLRDDDLQLPVETLDAVTPGGVVRKGNDLWVLRPIELAELAGTIRRIGEPHIPAEELRPFLARMWELPVTPDFDLPPELEPTSVRLEPKAQWRVESVTREKMRGRLGFGYGTVVIDAEDERTQFLDPEAWSAVQRDEPAELGWAAKLEQLLDAELERDADGRFARAELPRVAGILDEAGFQVWTEERRVRASRASKLAVSSGIDWFTLDGQHEFGDGLQLELPELLRALEEGQETVELADGSWALVPKNWLRRSRKLLALGHEVEGDLRFEAEQAIWLDQVLEDFEDEAGQAAKVDDAFARVRRHLGEGCAPEPADPSEDFLGTLRPYQREGLGWLRFLRQVGFGGVLADDMGLGKTVQVLAHLLQTRAQAAGPALVIAPRSVVHQWFAEAQRFAPRLDVCMHVGSTRVASAEQLGAVDLVVTSYGVVRRDVELLASMNWDTVVLDEAQAVKNAKTATARAVRKLPAEHRLVVTGTPVENHLGELANHLDFLNPGLFGSSSALRERFSRKLDEESAASVARALQPLLLRRTKDQVAKDLPERIEQELICDMRGDQRKLYSELRDHFAKQLLPQAHADGLPKMQIQVLEALLRLRQTACHPGLVADKHRAVASAKFEVLIPRLEELVEEGAKALVFSQFTTLLGLLKEELDQRGLRYESLDGRTRDRAERVQRFQEDPEVPLFLISLKAGGVGLNLTAAQYVFLLDPWWNPAVEAQAIDRAHRHGQRSRVVAYRLIARDTVEEKIRELQERKRALADSVLSGEGGIMRELQPDDLEILLG